MFIRLKDQKESIVNLDCVVAIQPVVRGGAITVSGLSFIFKGNSIDGKNNEIFFIYSNGENILLDYEYIMKKLGVEER